MVDQPRTLASEPSLRLRRCADGRSRRRKRGSVWRISRGTLKRFHTSTSDANCSPIATDAVVSARHLATHGRRKRTRRCFAATTGPVRLERTFSLRARTSGRTMATQRRHCFRSLDFRISGRSRRRWRSTRTTTFFWLSEQIRGFTPAAQAMAGSNRLGRGELKRSALRVSGSQMRCG